MTTRIRERVPATILRRSEITGDYEAHLELTAERFMGVLVHPVSRSEMLHKFGIDRRGCKVVAYLRSSGAGDCVVEVGDLLEVGGNTHLVVGAKAYPGCFLEIYLEEAQDQRR